MKSKTNTMRSKRLYVAIGLPGSGKSHLFKSFYDEDGVGYVSSDVIRKQLFGSAEVQDMPNVVFQEFLHEVETLLKDDSIHAVFADATHVHTSWRRDIIRLGRWLGVGDIRAVVIPPRIVRAWRQDRGRKRQVGLWVILKMAWKWRKPSSDEGFTSIDIIDYEQVL